MHPMPAIGIKIYVVAMYQLGVFSSLHMYSVQLSISDMLCMEMPLASTISSVEFDVIILILSVIMKSVTDDGNVTLSLCRSVHVMTTINSKAHSQCAAQIVGIIVIRIALVTYLKPARTIR